MRRALVVVALGGTLLVVGCTSTMPAGEESPETVPDGELEIHHIDVGQGDATLLIGPDDETMLIDTGGFRDNGTKVLDYLADHGIDRIDHLVTTHPHADHIGGHEAVIETYERDRGGVGAIYDSGVAHTTETYEEYLDAIERHAVTLYQVQQGVSIPFGNAVETTVLRPPENATTTELNDQSLVLLIEFGETAYLTTGDSEALAESQLVEEYSDELDADIYQAGHHGSSTSSSQEFIEAVDPNVAVASSAQDSPHSHPHNSTFKRFNKMDIETYWTGAHGDTVVATNGKSVSVRTQTDAPTDPLELLGLKPTEETASIAVTP